MKITYRREMKHNYMIIDPEALAWRGYECRMLAANSIDGVLRFQLRQVDDEVRFYYEITSRQPLARLLESQSLRAEQIRELVLGIARVLDRLEQYLLREGSVILEPEYIYVEPESYRVWLCLVPGLERDFPEDYGKLLEYLLGKVDHQDKESVTLAYGLYQETRKENYGMEDILHVLGNRNGEQSKEESGETGGARVCQAQREDDIYSSAEGKDQESPISGEIEAQRPTKRHSKTPKGAGGSIWKRFRKWLGERRIRYVDAEPVQVPWELMFRDEEHEDLGIELERSAARGDFRGSAPEAESSKDTVLLADVSPGRGTRLHRLRALDSDGEDIDLSYYPFVIGKQENLVDHVLLRDTVSRLHLRIDRQDDRYFVQDLNSTNGTSVAGRLLENNESAEVREGEEVRIAGYRYRFE